MLLRGPYKNRVVLYNRARELRLEGLGYRTIGKSLNINYNTIKNWVKDITLPKKVAYNNSNQIEKKEKPFNQLKKRESFKRRLIKERGRKCEWCYNIDWLNTVIPLEIDHINGNKENNSRENLRLLCPNCHALTDRGKNIGHGKINN